MLNRKSQGREIADAFLSPTGTKIIAQGQAKGRNPGCSGQHQTDPEGVEQTTCDVAPFQGAKSFDNKIPGVTFALLTSPQAINFVTFGDRKEKSLGRLANLRDAQLKI